MTRKAAAGDRRPGWGQRIPGMLFAAVFMVAFGAGGVAAGLGPMALTAWRAIEVRGWQAVPAQILDAQLDESRSNKGGSTFSVKARYAYRVNGRDYEGTRVGLLDWGSDNIGDWHHRWHARLTEARQSEQPVPAWVDPRQPASALLDRQVRWGMMAFHSLFGVLFTGVGVGAAVMFWRALRGAPTGTARRLSSDAASRSNSRMPGGTLARGVRGRLDEAAGVRFLQPWWRGLGVVMLLLALLLLPAWPKSAGAGGLLWVALPATLWLALALHLATLRWRWVRDGNRLRVERRSWLLTRQWQISRDELASVHRDLVYTSRTNGGPTVEHHRLQARRSDGSRVRLTPALSGPDAVREVEAHLRGALELRPTAGRGG